MSDVGKSERATQNRIVKLLDEELGYRYLGNWEHRSGNANIETDVLRDFLTKQGYDASQIARTLDQLRREANNPGRSLYDNNRAVYGLLRYGVPVQTAAGQNTDTVHLIDWAEPANNDFAVAEEVTVCGQHDKRPDIVLYLNGIAIAVLELKNSRVSIADGIRQSIVNQRPEFIGPFFSTVQFIFAGNDSEGLRYGTIGTPEKFFLKWKEDEADNTRFKLDKYLLKICNKARLIELLYDFVLFDAGVKKLPRVHQYFGVKAAQDHVRRREGGIIWHTQGSGKSMVMVLLAKWILENNAQARVAVVTDRDELDKQIEGVFTDAGVPIKRTSSGRELMNQLGQPLPRLLCSLVHKFGRKDVDDFEGFIRELEAQPVQTVGELFVFVDECHRTQSGKLHRTMKALMPNAVFIGFTGTPLLKQDQTSVEVFGGYIHTYLFDEAVEDQVVLDLVYEARDIDQRLGSEDKVDQWFEAKTRGLNDWQKAALREQWGTMQRVLSSRSRIDRVVSDIIFDFSVRPRLSDQRGNAVLVASSIYEACKYYERFQATSFSGHCAVVTSYSPLTQHITTEDTGANTETDKEFIYKLYEKLLEDVDARPGMTKTETYEEQVKNRFRKEPAQMKLLIVVDKLLTGFDAPSCTYLYIDKSMKDHGLFQAICRTNRLDGDDKEFGVIVDYKDLFRKLENAIAVYTSELAHEPDEAASPEILLKDRLTKGRERLDEAREAIKLLCEPVEPPKGELEHIHYFCGNTEIASELQAREPKRAALYKATAALLRAYANIADELERAGYGAADVAGIKTDIDHHLKLREVIRRASGETIDLKAYEADMRHLIDTYIEADEPRKISSFDDMPLLELIVKTGIARAIAEMPDGVKDDKEAVAETIENNVRSKIIKDHLNDPAFYDRMSRLLDEIIKARKARAIEYEEYLEQIAELARKVQAGQADDIPAQLDTQGKRALYNNLKVMDGLTVAAEEPAAYGDQSDVTARLALQIDDAIRLHRPDGWRGVMAKENIVKQAMYNVLGDIEAVETLFPIIVRQSEY